MYFGVLDIRIRIIERNLFGSPVESSD
jgi:hypothetical protein